MDWIKNKKLYKLIYQLQKLNKKPNTEKQIDEIGRKIFEGKLIDKCDCITFAKQLMIKNNVPRKYWG